jgi:hypothetical protein
MLLVVTSLDATWRRDAQILASYVVCFPWLSVALSVALSLSLSLIGACALYRLQQRVIKVAPAETASWPVAIQQVPELETELYPVMIGARSFIRHVLRQSEQCQVATAVLASFAAEGDDCANCFHMASWLNASLLYLSLDSTQKALHHSSEEYQRVVEHTSDQESDLMIVAQSNTSFAPVVSATPGMWSRVPGSWRYLQEPSRVYQHLY